MIRLPALLAAFVLAPAAAAQDSPRLEALGTVLDGAAFSGEVRMRDGSLRDEALYFHWQTDYPGPPAPPPGHQWRLASITKQIVAVLVMQQVEGGRLDLDAPVGRYVPGFAAEHAGTITIRQLLQHRSGLANPDDTPAGADGIPAFYRPGFAGSRDPLRGYCAGPAKAAPGGEWAYNNCDYMVLGAVLEAVTGKTWSTLARERLPLAKWAVGFQPEPDPEGVRKATIDGAPERRIALAAFSDRAPFDFGEVWQGKGFSYALLSAAACVPPGKAER